MPPVSVARPVKRSGIRASPRATRRRTGASQRSAAARRRAAVAAYRATEAQRTGNTGAILRPRRALRPPRAPPPRDSIAAGMARWIGVLLLFVLLCAEVAAHGPLTLSPPATILSNAAKVQRETEPFVLFLHWVAEEEDRKSTRLNSSHMSISYAVFC